MGLLACLYFEGKSFQPFHRTLKKDVVPKTVEGLDKITTLFVAC